MAAVAPNPLETFIWGAGGSKKTPEQVARERDIAEALLMKAGNTAPVGHWTQGAARVVDALSGVVKQNRANTAEEEGRAGFQSQWDSVFGGGAGGSSPVAQALIGGGVAPASVPTGGNAAAIREGLISRGLPEHIADGFLMNFQDESGLNSGINEASPTVPGSRGGYGLYQLTGPRRIAYEQYAQQKGVDPSDINAQLDFMMSELKGPEANAAKAIFAAPDAGSAAAAIVNKFLRPAEEHRARRVASYTGGGAQPPAQVASLGDVSAYAPQPTENAQQAIAQALVPQPQQVAQAQFQPSFSAPQGTGQPSMQQLMSLASDPWASDAQKSIVQSLLGQQMQQQDPMYQLQRQKAELELQAMQNPSAPKPIEVGGVLLDPTTYQPIFDSRSDTGFTLSPGQQRFDAQGNPIASGGESPGFRPLSAEEASASNLDPSKGWQVGPDNRIYEIGGGGVNVNLGDQGQRMGPIPAGMAAVPDPTNPAGFRMEPIPGGPIAQQAEAAAAAQLAGQEVAGRTNNIVREDLGRIKDIVQNAPWYNPAVGFGAKVASAIEGSNATNVAALSKTVLANIGFDRLQQMRDASPTGGALGAISDRELGTLQAVMGNLEQSQSIDQFVYNLDRLGQVYEEISAKASAYPNASGFGFTGPSGQTSPNGAPQAGAVEDGYRFKGGNPADPNNWEQVR